MEESLPESLELLRQEARDELSAMIDFRCRQGDDPWQFLPELPSVDEQVVLTLRADAIASDGMAERRSRAYHPTSGEGAAEAFEYELLRTIALTHPQLTTTVWNLIGRIDAA